jgi:vitamin B12/bleomycin/antimicrobial peptide transport system ATP-binding/permease protein
MKADEDRDPSAATGSGDAAGAPATGRPRSPEGRAIRDAARADDDRDARPPAAEHDPFAPPEAPVTRAPSDDDAEGAPFRTGPWREARRLATIPGPPRERRRLVLLAAGIAVVLFANMVAAVRLNAWQGGLFDAIDRRGLAAFGQQLATFAWIAAALVVLVVAQTWMQEMLKVRLREWLTDRLLDAWLAPGRAYRLAMTSELGVNPDQRIQEDTRHLTQLTVDLGVGLLYSTLLLVSFVGVLWSLSSGVTFEVGGRLVTIPGYMVWCAAGYALLGSGLTWLVGRPLIGLNALRQAREADLRFALVRVSESAESIALYRGEADERRALGRSLGPVVAAMRRLSGSVARLTWITSGYGFLAIVVPVLVAAPGYFAGRLTLGELMMVVGAFGYMQNALRWFVDNFARLADWRAALGRVAAFREALDGAAADAAEEGAERIELAPHPEGRLAFERVGVLLRDGGVVIREATAEVRPGERVLIVGASGSGKSTLFRAVAGLWPWGGGRILLPPRGSMMFLPQQPYLPLGSLRVAAAYPARPGDLPPGAVEAALRRVGLGELVPMLDLEERWDRVLSVGQRQRLAFARLLLHRPGWVFLDEATAALDEENQRVAMSIFDRELPDAAVVSVGHRPGLEAFHTRVLELAPSPSGARLRLRRRAPAPGEPPPRERLLAVLRERWPPVPPAGLGSVPPR